MRASSSPIIPAESHSLRSLTIAMAVMCYLASLAIGGLIVINHAVEAWTAGIASEITVQVRPLTGSDVAAEVAKARAILAATPGLSDVAVLNEKAGADLLEPWLGTGVDLSGLPVPRLVTARIGEPPPDLDALAAVIAAKVKGGSLDTHRRWQAELTRTAGTLQFLAVVILLLIALSAAALVLFATRAALDANRETVEVLHLVGARDSFIARAVDGRFLMSGLSAGLIGAGGALATFLAISLFGGDSAAGTIGEASRHLVYAPPGLALWNYAAFLIVPVIATLISLITAHLAMLRILRRET